MTIAASVMCVMVSVLALSTIDHGFEPRSGQTKDYKIVIPSPTKLRRDIVTLPSVLP